MASQRILGAVKFDLSSIGDEYSILKKELVNLSWWLVDMCRKQNLYCQIYTFPGWKNSRDMNDFSWIHEKFPLNGFDTLSFKITDSPIDDALGTIASHLGFIETIISPRLRLSFDDILNPEPNSRINFIKQTILSESPLARCLLSILHHPRISEAIVVVSESWDAEQIIDTLDIDEIILRICLTSYLFPELDVGYKFKVNL